MRHDCSFHLIPKLGGKDSFRVGNACRAGFQCILVHGHGHNDGRHTGFIVNVLHLDLQLCFGKDSILQLGHHGRLRGIQPLHIVVINRDWQRRLVLWPLSLSLVRMSVGSRHTAVAVCPELYAAAPRAVETVDIVSLFLVPTGVPGSVVH